VLSLVSIILDGLAEKFFRPALARVVTADDSWKPSKTGILRLPQKRIGAKKYLGPTIKRDRA